MNQPPTDLFAYGMDELLYNGRSGAVNASDTSRERADTEDATGVTTARVNAVLDQLKLRPDGMIWPELAAVLKLHHGQISGCLSMMHKGGLVFALRDKRSRCHPYVHSAYRASYGDRLRLDAPVKTKATLEREALDVLLKAVDDLLEAQTWETIKATRVARALHLNAERGPHA